jgi:DNA repair exonuclease SbcCD ATPase subunit
MLKITRLEIEDFGRHKQIHHDLDGHVVGLTGPNGKGKSTVLQAIQFALTGSVDHDDSLPAFIRKEDSAKPPKKATVRLWFEADGKKGSITRAITPTTNSRELRWDGYEDGKPVSADKKVNEILFDILGVDKKAINSTVFIKQGSIGDMFGGNTERRDFYIRLMMLGHLTKVADVVDTYRKQISDSVQDLSAVLDAANVAAEEASDYFETTDAELAALRDYAPDISQASELLTLFSEQTEAEQALANITVTDVAADAEELRRRAEDTVSTISAMRRDYMADVTAHNKATRELEQGRVTFDLMAQKSAKETELASVSARLAGGDPSSRILAAEQTIAGYTRMAQIPAELHTAKVDLEKAGAELTQANATLVEVTATRQALQDEYAGIAGDLKIRKAIQLGMASEHAHEGDCLVCGSKSPDSNYLTRTIAELEASLRTVVEQGNVIRPAFDAAGVEVQRTTAANALAVATVAALENELLRVRAGLLGAPTLEEASAAKVALQDARVAFNAASADYTRISGDIANLGRQLSVRPACSGEQLLALEAAVLPVSEWPAENDTAETEAASLVASLSYEIRKAADSAAQFAEAQTRVSRVRDSLLSKLAEVSASNSGLTALLSAEGILTHAGVLQATDALRHLQTDYHQTVGRLVAARESLRNANSKVIEIETRIAEQGERRRLADDLARLRDTFKPSGVATEYLDYRFGQVARLASEYLAESGADFMVCASTEIPLAYDFLRLDRPSEVWMPQSRMSGGQRVRLAVATLRAIHALIMPNVGLMVLDEPTTHLDDDAVRSMAEMLRGIGAEGNLQMIVCDHNPVLIDAFSDTITLV